MNYNHLYHAGNFADIIKHSVLIALIMALQKKESPCCIVDTHAGSGRYDLQSSEAHVNREFQTGLIPLMQHTARHPAIVQLQKIIMDHNPSGELWSYPGSPCVSAQMLRPLDRLILIEKHPHFFQDLKKSMQAQTKNRTIALHERDAYEALGALLPPMPRRGLVLIDPPYENKNESTLLWLALQTAIKRWPQATYAVWYPLTQKTVSKPVMMGGATYLEMHVFPEGHVKSLIGCGMMLINMPWCFRAVQQPLEQELKAIMCTF